MKGVRYFLVFPVFSLFTAGSVFAANNFNSNNKEINKLNAAIKEIASFAPESPLIDKFNEAKGFSLQNLYTVNPEISRLRYETCEIIYSERSTILKERNVIVQHMEEEIGKAINLGVDSTSTDKALSRLKNLSASQNSLDEISLTYDLINQELKDLKKDVEQKEIGLQIKSLEEYIKSFNEVKDFFSEYNIYPDEISKIDQHISEIEEFISRSDIGLEEIKLISEEKSEPLAKYTSNRQSLDKDYLAKRQGWVDSFASVDAPSSPKPSGEHAKQILVDLSDQRMYVYDRGDLVHYAPVTTGKNGFGTPPGEYSILNRVRNVTLRGDRAFPGQNIEYEVKSDMWMAFRYDGFGFHDAYRWRSVYGGQDYTYSGSHGCINTPLDAMKFIFSWADVGTFVKVQN